MEIHLSQIVGGAIALVLVFAPVIWPFVVMAREWLNPKCN